MKYIVATGLFVLAACSNSTGPTNTAADTTKAEGAHASAPATTGTLSEPMPLAGCYEMTIKRDTATLNLQVADTVVTGDLVYHWYEKDGNEGTIKGVLRNNLIIADYTFQSEGITSVREVIFKIENNTLLQAFGPLVDKGSKIVFADTSKVDYITDNPFVKVDCP